MRISIYPPTTMKNNIIRLQSSSKLGRLGIVEAGAKGLETVIRCKEAPLESVHYERERYETVLKNPFQNVSNFSLVVKYD